MCVNYITTFTFLFCYIYIMNKLEIFNILKNTIKILWKISY